MNTRRNKPALDTNLIIRFLTEDNPEQAEAVQSLLQRSTSKFVIPDLTLAEIVYVLLSVYELPKKEVIEKVRAIILFEKFDTNEKIMLKTLKVFEENNISFVDSYLLALNMLDKVSSVYSFDKKLGKVQGVNVQIPS